MKILLTFFVLLFSSSVVAYEWTKFGTTANYGDTLYYDSESIIKFEQEIFLWQMLDYKEKSEWGDLSVITYRKIECNTFNFRDLVVYFYDQNMGQGKLTVAFTPPEEFRSVKERSITESFFSVLCN